MRNIARLALVLIIIVLAAFALKLRHTSTANTHQDRSLIVHEWGTFTSIAGKDGIALEWRPLNGSVELPKFVHTIDKADAGLRHASKADMVAAVRIETPVLYFYTDREMNVSAQVDFPRGKITEWYPQARTVGAGINWGTLKVAPSALFTLPADYSNNHYYAARETDAAPVQVCATNGHPAEQEKFLFYRGVGDFDLPLRVKLENEKIVLQNSGKEQIAQLIVFENRDGKIGFRLLNNFAGERTIDRPAFGGDVESVIRELQRALISSGLYEKEADAMIKTWRDSWFESGLRVFYILPRRMTDAVLPITIDPKPTDLVRVLVGRTEVITPEMKKSVENQLKLLGDSSATVREATRVAIQRYGRFTEPILKQMMADENDPVLRARIKQILARSAPASE